jgi:hypothetical protein
MNYRAYALLTLPILVMSCHRQPDTGDILARVGDAVLTMKDARAYIDTTQGQMEIQLKHYVTYWVNTELVYQEAKRQGTENSEQFNERLYSIRRQLANQTYLDQHVYSDTGEITNDSVRKYYDEHTAEFSLREDMIKLNVVTFASRERASVFAAAVSQGMTWDSALTHVQRDAAVEGKTVTAVSPQYFSSRTLFPQELWKVATALHTGELSFPVKTSTGSFTVLQSIAIARQGAQADFEIARDEARQRLLYEARRHMYDTLLSTLRKRYDVQIFVGNDIPMDSAHVHE